MKQHLKKIFLLILSVAIIISTFNNGIIPVKADGEHQFLIKAYDWDPFYNDWEGLGSEEEITANSDVEPGQVIQISSYYIPGSIPEVSLQGGIKYDSSLVEPMNDPDTGDFYGEMNPLTTANGGPWPPKGNSASQKTQTNWNLQYSHYEEGHMITFYAMDGQLKDPLKVEGILVSFWFKVKDNAPAGAVINFSYDDKQTMVNEDRPKSLSGLTLNVFGEMSEDVTLGSLTVNSEDGTNYPLTPEFVPNNGSQKEYSVVVPNHVSSINVSADATDERASVASGTGKNTLNVGNNDINLIVQAQDGTQETYVLHVYRLNNDATLKSLSLSNDINIGDFSPETTTYTATVPYSTNNTVVSAEQNDENAEIASGTGNWNLESYGATVNKREVVVKAENCNVKYSLVPNNSCSDKTYSIDVTRTAPSSNANLSYLTVDGKSVPDFSPTKYEYTLDNVSNSTTSVNVNALVEDTGKATIISSLGEKTLEVGDNQIIVKVQAEDGTTTREYKINIRRLSNDSKLLSLTVTSEPMGELSPVFSNTYYNYTYTAPATVETVTIQAEKNDSSAEIVSGPGQYNIDTTSSVDVVVQSEEGTQSTYVVKLVRTKSDNANLSSLSIEGYDLNQEFNPLTTSYTANVSGDVSEITVNATVQDVGKAQILSGTGKQTLQVGPNTITVRVQAENGTTTKDYTITVNRAKKTISSLTELKVDGKPVEGFEESKLEYDLGKVEFEKTSVLIEATPKDIDSEVSGTGTIPLSTGENKLYVTVTAQDNTYQTTYTLNIEREKDNNAYLSNITIDGVTISGFEKTKFDYEVEVPNETTSLNLVATTDSTLASHEITGNSNFVTTQKNLVKITVTAEAGNIEIYTINVIRAKSDNNYLKSITLSDGTLNPGFEKTKNDYTVDVDRSVTSITITATVDDPSAIHNITGPSELQIGENTFKITVTSESGIDNVYTIIVNRNASSNNYLSDLKVDNETVTGFRRDKFSYTIDVDSTKENIEISATTDDIYATTDGTGTFPLQTGENTFKVVVTAEDKSERTYTIIVNKAKSDNSALSSLSVVQTTISPTFSPTVLNYTASVPYSVTNVDIVATPSDTKSQVTGDGNHDLNTGENTFQIVVTSENNTSTTYTLVITRAKNDNAYLSNIVLSGGFDLDPTFESSITEYNVKVPNTTESIEITAYKQDPNATVTGEGTKDLTPGENEVKLIVVAEDGTTKKTYTITIDRARSSDATLKELSVSPGTLNPVFEKNTTDYEVTVPNEIESVTVTAVPTSSEASRTITGNTELKVGSNTCKITVTAGNGDTKVYIITIIRQPSTNNFLASLSVKDSAQTEYIESFLNTKLEYNITVENNVDKVTILGVADDNTSKVEGNGEKQLDIGQNSFDVVVTSASDISRTYTIKIFRKANSNNYLTKLEVEGYTITPTFERNELNYTLKVDSLVDKIKIIAEPEVETSVVSGAGEQELHTGENTFNITVQAEDTSIRTYVIVITKEASNNNYLANLTVSVGELTPGFNRETLDYTVHVGNETKTMNIEAEPEHPSASVEGAGLKSLSVGTHRIDIVVKAENNETRTYTVTVTRDESSNNYLSDLKVNGESLQNFNKDVEEYELDVENSVDSITVEAILADETASVSGDGPIDLHTGENIIQVTVTAENGSIRTYTIKVTRAKSSNNYLLSLDVAEGQINPAFHKETVDYNITVPYEVTSLTIDAKPEVTTSRVEIKDNNNFVVGSNKVLINVIAENEDVRTYTINVTRQQEANNYLTDIVVTDKDGVRYSLSPQFNRTEYSYEVAIPATLTDVNISVTKQDPSLIVEGDGEVPITSLPQIQKVIVKTTDGLERTYTLNFVKGLSANAKLKSITVTPGELSPAFDKDELDYTVDLPAGTTSITINAEKGDETQQVTGTGTIQLSPGSNKCTVTVTAEDGSLITYTITVNVEKSDDDNPTNNVLTSLTVDKGVLTPAFEPNTKLYTVDLDSSEEDITISATGSNTITGTGKHQLVEGANVFEIISTDSKGEKNIYRVVVNRGSIVSAYLKYLAVDNYELQEPFNKENYNYNLSINGLVNSLDVIAIPEDKNATVTITGNNNLTVGNNTISITVTDETSTTLTYTINVNIGRNKIESDIHKIEESYIQTIAESKTAKEVKDEMLNPNEQLKIYNLSDVEISDTTIVGTGYKIKLIINGKEYDSKILIIKGDLNSDGEVGVSDIIKLRLHILETSQLDTYASLAADTNNDNEVGVSDILKIRNHIIGNIDLFAKEGE